MKINDKFISHIMQAALVSPSPYLKSIANNTVKQGSKFFPYKTQSFRWNEYRKSRIAIVKKIHQPKPPSAKQQSQKLIHFPNKEQTNNHEPSKNTVIQEILRSKSPLVFRKSLNKDLEERNPASEIKTVTSLMEPIPVFIPAQNKSPQFKLHSLKQLPQSISKQKQTIFRKTFCSSLNKPNKNRSLQTKAQQRRPPTSNLQTYRPVTRIRKVSNIGEESNSNFLAKYQIIKELGKGTYGTVYLAKVMKKKDQLPNLFNTSFFNVSNMLTNNSVMEKTIQTNKEISVQYFSLLTQNPANDAQKANEHVNEQDENPSKMQTSSDSTKKIEVLANRQDQQLQASCLQEQPNKEQKTNESSAQNQKKATEYAQDDELVAIKVYEKFKMNKDPAKFKNIRKEITIMQNLNHEGVIKLYESVESITKISLVVQYGGEMSLLDYLRKNYPLNPQKLKDFSRQLLKTIIYLHDKNIVHRDIKPQNILVKFNKNTNQETLKLIDYGFSTLTNKSRRLNVICGTPNFMAPELLSSKEYFGEKADVWSYGVVIFVMAEGRHPFKSAQYQELTRLANKGKFIFKRKHEPVFEQFINKILKVNSDQRPSAAQISKFKWLQQQ